MTDKHPPLFNDPFGAAPAASGLPVFDHLTALARLDDDQELLATLLAMALENMPKTIAQLEKSLSNGDANQVKLEAHKLKGMAAAVGAVALTQMAALIQSLATDQALMLIGARMASLNHEFTQFKDEAKRVGY